MKIITTIALLALLLNASAQYTTPQLVEPTIKEANRPFMQSFILFGGGLASYMIGQEIKSPFMQGVGLTTIALSFTFQIQSIERHRLRKKANTGLK